MSDVFVSYARLNEVHANRISESLIALGYAVWRDDQLPAHRPYAEVIEERLKAARAVVVVWSAEAAKSQWVRAEADFARTAGTLVQLRVDEALPPMPFGQIECADLARWAGELDHPGWRKVASSVAELVAASAPQPTKGAAISAATIAEPLLAVLAFDNLSADPEMTYFSDGISEEIQQTVACAGNLRVLARSSSFQFRGSEKAARHVAERLRATHLLDGSVRRSGTRVRISAQLVDCASEITLWSERFDRDLSDIFALQDEIAAAVSAALKKAFAPTRSPQAIDPAAYDLYLRVCELRQKTFDQTEVIERLRQVVTSAPTFARAWADLAWAVAFDQRSGKSKTPFSLARAEVLDATERALTRDPKSDSAYLALELLEPDGNYASREALLLKALACAPEAPDVLTTAAKFYATVGRWNDSLAFSRRAREVDPLRPSVVISYAGCLSAVQRGGEALAFLDDACLRWPTVSFVMMVAISVAANTGDWRRFDTWVASTRETGLDQDADIATTIRFSECMRTPDPALMELAQAFGRGLIDAQGYVPLTVPAFLANMGLTDAAFDLVGRASYDFVMEGDGRPLADAYSPAIIFQGRPGFGLRHDRRFLQLCAKLRLCDYWISSSRWPDCAQDGSLNYDFKAETFLVMNIASAVATPAL